jgi:D-alanyl-D-alanine carboxypeptidase/D-alanyl-D-alanine-endopeptidase (penicillin-binding protein 4)
MPWSVHQSEPLAQLVRDINKTSDNLAARNLMLSLCQGFPQRVATLAEARERIAGWLQRQGLASDDLWVDNGSGLSRAERGKPRAMVQLLRGAWGSPQGQALLESLPVAGIDGTLAHRMTHGQATGRAFLKTGSLLDTRALAGYVQAASGGTYAVTVLVNHPDAARATPAMDRLIEWVAARG